MTLHSTGQMQLVIAPLLNDHELLTPVYLDNYLINPDDNKMSDMIDLARKTGDTYYSSEQVENGAADGAYSKNKSVRDYYTKTLDTPPGNEWITLRLDYAHQIDHAEEDAKEGKDAPQTIETIFDLAQNITKTFRYGKEYARLVGRTTL